MPEGNGKRYNVTKDSGKKQEFDTGAHRDTQEGKGRFDLIPPAALKRLAGVYERGAEKYGQRNWEKGMPIGRYLDSALRHIFQHIEGRRDEDHLAQAMWNVAGAIHTETMIDRGILPAELDDLPNHLEPTEDSEWGWMKAYVGRQLFADFGIAYIRQIRFVSGGILSAVVSDGSGAERILNYADRHSLEAAMDPKAYVGKTIIAEEGAGSIIQALFVDNGIVADVQFKNLDGTEQARKNIYYPNSDALAKAVAQGRRFGDGPVDVDGQEIRECPNTSST